jgi:hypothetical protein
MATVFQVQIRCKACNRRLADVVNEIEIGQAIIELKCPRCANQHLEILRPLDPQVFVPLREGTAVKSTRLPASKTSATTEKPR